MQAAQTMAGARPAFSYEPVPGATVVQPERPHESPTPGPPAGPPAHLRKSLAIAGVAAAVLVAGVATVVYLVRVPPLASVPVTSAPAQTPSKPASGPPQVSAAAPGGLEIVPPRPPEPVTLPEPVAPPKPKPVPEAKSAPAPPKPAPPPRPAAPPAKPSQPPLTVAKPGSDTASADGLRAQLEDRLRSRGLLRGSGTDPNTGVTVEVGPNGVVTLRGIVLDVTQRDEVANLVRLAGVSEVRLRVNVQRSWN